MKTVFLIMCLLGPVLGVAQPAPTDSASHRFNFKRITQTADLSLATKGDFNTISLSLVRLRGLGRSHRFRVGFGLRFTAAFGRNTDYRTAPSRLAKGPGHPSALGLFAPTLDENLDTLRLSRTQAYSLNISGNLEYALSRRVAIGANLDMVGFTVGPDQTGTFIASSPAPSPLSGTMQDARLTAFNALIGDQSDRGSLNTEGYIRYRLNPRLSLRAGASLIVNEYTTTRPLTFGNDRFRSGNNRVVLAFSYHL
ncbi:MAG: hypothetical protein H7Z72_00470 [Bacteroidetes bacterium]|nr:hypothetical protein [Fibrella sp.]